jgi:hypothetical protein
MAPKPATESKPTAAQTKLAKDIQTARRVGTPLIGIRTTDAAATIASLSETMNGAPVIQWDVVRGAQVAPKHAASENALAVIVQKSGAREALLNLQTMLDAAQYAPENTVVYIHNAPMFFEDKPTRQAIWNLRDRFKVHGQTLILLGIDLVLPAELEGDVMTFDEPLPSAAQIEAIIRQQIQNADLQTKDYKEADTIIAKAVDACLGLTSFSVEQNTAMSLRKSDLIDIAALQDRRCAMINQTPGLSVWRGPETFDGIGGNANIKAFMQRLINGNDRFGSVVWIDEIEKQMAGAGGDTSGVSQDQHMQMLTYMQNRRVPALLLVGHPGVAKSEIAKATGNAAGVLTLQFDLGAMTGSLVGQSQEKIRRGLQVVDAVSAGKPLFIATCNDLSALSPELRSRFRLGTFFFDLPTDAERNVIWQIHTAKAAAGQPLPKQPRPRDTGWTGREIASCCDLAYRLNATLTEAAAYIVPVATSQQARVERLRAEAHGRFINAGAPGFYDKDAAADMPAPAIEDGGRRRISAAD